MAFTSIPEACRARIDDSRPEPGPLTCILELPHAVLRFADTHPKAANLAVELLLAWEGNGLRNACQLLGVGKSSASRRPVLRAQLYLRVGPAARLIRAARGSPDLLASGPTRGLLASATRIASSSVREFVIVTEEAPWLIAGSTIAVLSRSTKPGTAIQRIFEHINRPRATVAVVAALWLGAAGVTLVMARGGLPVLPP